jgi:SAM-dependent methyltransferase
LAQQNPQPAPKGVIERYGLDYFRYEIENSASFLSLSMKALRDLGFRRAARGSRALGRPPRFLDLGCATGALLQSLAGRGFDCKGVEVCEAAAAYAREERGIDVLSCTLEEAAFPDSSFDFVHASHVIEHLNEPALFLEEAWRILEPGGYLILVTPDRSGLQARMAGRAWRSAINDHLYLFSKRDLKAMVRGAGFRVLRIRTWGGLAKGLRPDFLKPLADRMAKAFGFGDVVALLARKPHK